MLYLSPAKTFLKNEIERSYCFNFCKVTAILSNVCGCLLSTFIASSKTSNASLYENSAYKRGQELLDAGQYEEAIQKFAEVIAENPRAWKAMNSQGFAYQKMSKYTDAVECFDKALAVNPKSVEVLNNKGVTLSMRCFRLI